MAYLTNLPFARNVPKLTREPKGSNQLFPTFYKMVGQRTSDGVWISWEVSGAPDTTGAFAGVAVVLSTISHSGAMRSR